MNLLHYVNVIGAYLVYLVHWKQCVVKELLDRNQDYQNNIQLFNIHLIFHYQHQVDICGGKKINFKLISRFLFFFFFAVHLKWRKMMEHPSKFEYHHSIWNVNLISRISNHKYYYLFFISVCLCVIRENISRAI
jgi:hypothetical protein